MIHKTKGIVLRSVKYGETSLIVTIFTELFGLQTYMVKGSRSSRGRGPGAVKFQPSAILDMEVYHNEQRPMQMIKECNWAYLYEHILADVVKNSIALYMMELLQKTLKQPETNSSLFAFCAESLVSLDTAGSQVAANFPLFFAIHLTEFFGFRISSSNLRGHKKYLDLREGEFVNQQPLHPDFIQGLQAGITEELLMTRLPSELEQLKLNKQIRRELLLKYQDYYALHIHDFGQMRTLKVLQEILS